MRRGSKPNLNQKEEPRPLTHEEKLEQHRKMRQFLWAMYSDVAAAERMFKADRQCLHYRSSIGETAFHYLIIEDQIDLAGKLLDWGAKINTQDDFGSTPLMSAVMLRKLDTLKWLVQRGADLEFKTKNHDTALSLATFQKRPDAIRFLLSLPRKNPIDFYFDDSTALQVYEDTNLVVRDELIALGLSKRHWDLED